MTSVEDQAAGLRRLFDVRPSQVVAFAASDARCGRTALVIQTALALAQAGERVLIIDENEGRNCATRRMNVKVPGDMWDSLIGRLPLECLITPAAEKVWLLAAAGIATRLHQDTDVIRDKLNLMIDPMRRGAEFILIDSQLAASGGLSMLSSIADHVIVIVGAEQAGITESYGLIKRLSLERGRERFHLVVTRAKTQAVAKKVFDNLRQTARQHLGVSIEWLAAVKVPTAENLAEEIYSRLPLPSRGVTGSLL